MTQNALGRVEEAGLREAWAHEAHQFTPWLLDNLDDLSEAIGIRLEAEDSEVSVGAFFADIIARDVHTGARVLIENQLECSDHMHLGQILTYLAGLDAKIVVWIASEFREPHLSALRWLNDSTDDGFAFFAVKLKVIRIADSPLAPVFDVLVRPNGWERQLQAAAPRSGMSTELKTQKIEILAAIEQRLGRETRSTGASNRWLPLPDTDLVLSIFAITDGVGLFVRGPRNAPDDHARTVLTPHAEVLEPELGVAMGRGPGAYFEILRPWNRNAPDTWGADIDWVVETIGRYESVLRRVLKDE